MAWQTIGGGAAVLVACWLLLAHPLSPRSCRVRSTRRCRDMRAGRSGSPGCSRSTNTTSITFSPATVRRARWSARRRAAFEALSRQLRQRLPLTSAATGAAAPVISDLQFVSRYRVPFQFSRVVRMHLASGTFLQGTDDVTVTDLDGNRSYDLAGSYGVNVFGYEFYRSCIEAAVERVHALGPVLGSYHPVVTDNARRLCAISGLDEVSFHMSGTEAVMQAVRLARYHTRHSHVVQFCGAYHGWWDGVQPGVGNPGPVRDVYVLKEMDAATLRVLRTRRDIACVLVNPLQALHPNAAAPGDGTLLASRPEGRVRQGGVRFLAAPAPGRVHGQGHRPHLRRGVPWASAWRAAGRRSTSASARTW